MGNYCFDIKIMTCQDRFNMAKLLSDKLNISDENIFVDYDRKGPLFNAIQCWQAPIPDNITHRILLQDDAITCNDFKNICQMIISAHPECIFNLFPFDLSSSFLGKDVKDGYYTVLMFFGVGIIMPVQYIDSFVEYATLYPQGTADDLTLQYFVYKNNIPSLQFKPAIIQHDVVDSVANPNAPIRMTPFFEMDPKFDWSRQDFIDIRPNPLDPVVKKIAEKIEWSKQYIKNLAKERSQNNDK